MPTCPQGHSTAALDFCDVCGMSVSAAPGGSGTAGPVRAASMPCPECGVPLTGRFCEGCGYDTMNPPEPGSPESPESAESAESAELPESAGSVDPPDSMVSAQSPEPADAPDSADSAGPGDPAGNAPWSLQLGRDRAYYDRVMAEDGSDPADLPFPDEATGEPAIVALTGDEIRIGRRRASRNHLPEVDLSEAHEDLAVSHEHAVLRPRDDGSWVLVDSGSTNGTLLNDTGDPIEPGAEMPLSDGDRIYLGAWTVLTVRSGDPASGSASGPATDPSSGPATDPASGPATDPSGTGEGAS